MNSKSIDAISSAQQKRLSYIDFRVNYLGSISRRHLINRFGIKEAAASRDIAEYRALVSGNLDFESTRKIYIRNAEFVPYFEFGSSQVLTALSEGFGDVYRKNQTPLLNCDVPSQLNHPRLEIISELSRAIKNEKVISIGYRSIGSGLSTREIVPFAFINTGLRWHVRAYDRKRSAFIDFVITRISDPKINESDILDCERMGADIQWNRIVELIVVAHPGLKNPDTIEFDFGMIDGKLKVNVRAAVAGYLLRIWNIDCSDDGSLEGNEFHLWLANNAALYGVESLAFAPGYSSIEA